MKAAKKQNITKVIIVMIAIATGINLSAQSNSYTSFKFSDIIITNAVDSKLNFNLLSEQSFFLSKSSFSGNRYSDYYHEGLGIFCKAENKILDVSKIPFKFRLGSVQYVDWLESKPNSSFNFR